MSARAWNRRRSGKRWKHLTKRVRRAPLGTPVTAEWPDFTITVTVEGSYDVLDTLPPKAAR